MSLEGMRFPLGWYFQYDVPGQARLIWKAVGHWCDFIDPTL